MRNPTITLSLEIEVAGRDEQERSVVLDTLQNQRKIRQAVLSRAATRIAPMVHYSDLKRLLDIMSHLQTQGESGILDIPAMSAILDPSGAPIDVDDLRLLDEIVENAEQLRDQSRELRAGEISSYTISGNLSKDGPWARITFSGARAFLFPLTVTVQRYQDMDDQDNHSDVCGLYYPNEHAADCPITEPEAHGMTEEEALEACECGSSDECNCEAQVEHEMSRTFNTNDVWVPARVSAWIGSALWADGSSAEDKEV